MSCSSSSCELLAQPLLACIREQEREPYERGGKDQRLAHRSRLLSEREKFPRAAAAAAASSRVRLLLSRSCAYTNTCICACVSAAYLLHARKGPYTYTTRAQKEGDDNTYCHSVPSFILFIFSQKQ